MISIIIPCFNSEKTLESTIRSVLQQNVEKEIIVVDDGSTDGSVGIAQKFGNTIQCVRTPNRGASAARNLGTQRARGQFIQYLDSDDLLEPDTIASRHEELRRTFADVAYTDWEKIDQVGNSIPHSRRNLALPATLQDAEVAIATSRFWAPPGAFLFRRTAIDQIAGWNTDLTIGEDVRFLFDVVRTGAVFVRVPAIGLKYRIRADSLSRTNKAKFIADCARLSRQLEGIWGSPGPATQRQCRALAEMWSHVATSSLVNGFQEFEEAVAAHNRYSSPNWKFEIGRIMRRILNAKRSARLVGQYINAKAAFRKRLETNSDCLV
jgi:glycosyltransferase involved in cell wall biosynthesis